jgi:hypothetical protein
MSLVVDSTATSVRVAASAIGVIFSRMKAFLDDAGSLLRELLDRDRRESIVLSGVSVTPPAISVTPAANGLAAFRIAK